MVRPSARKTHGDVTQLSDPCRHAGSLLSTLVRPTFGKCEGAAAPLVRVLGMTDVLIYGDTFAIRSFATRYP